VVGTADLRTPPLVSGVSASPSADVRNRRTVHATVQDQITGSTPIKGAFAILDGWHVIRMSAADGTFDEGIEDVVVSTRVANPVRWACVLGVDLLKNISSPKCVTFGAR
jgi:hypothetical protein